MFVYTFPCALYTFLYTSGSIVTPDVVLSSVSCAFVYLDACMYVDVYVFSSHKLEPGKPNKAPMDVFTFTWFDPQYAVVGEKKVYFSGSCVDVGGGKRSVFSCESGYVEFSEALLTKFRSLRYTHVRGSSSCFCCWLF